MFTGVDFVQEFNRAMNQPIGEPAVTVTGMENLRGVSGDSTPDAGHLKQVKVEQPMNGELPGPVPGSMSGFHEELPTDPMVVEGPLPEETGTGHFSFLSVYTGIHMMEEDDCQSVHSTRTTGRTGPATESVAVSLRSYHSCQSTASR